MEKSRSRGGLWVMLRDETPRGFIEERRGEKEERGRGGEGEGEEERGGMQKLALL